MEAESVTCRSIVYGLPWMGHFVYGARPEAAWADTRACPYWSLAHFQCAAG